ncbi:MAG: PQQ-binding-like beta-propeller repeat protein [Phycisphaerales bacterium]|nr:PQQ-binding-like beta-propeller repeat protein [Planctomycetota bacterium]
MTAILPLFCGGLTAFAQGTWPTVAGDSSRTGTTAQAFPSLAASAWICGKDENGRAITFVQRAGVAAGLHFVYAVGSVVEPSGTNWKLFAIARRTGQVAWSVPIDAPEFESTATPAIDERAATVVVAGGSTLYCVSLYSPTIRWSASLFGPVVNASPVIARSWRGPGRLFVTDYDGFGDSASLYSINLDAYSAQNPFQPGEILWAFPIGASSGNSPSYDPATDRLYVATVGLYASNPGQIFALPAHGGTNGQPPLPLWTISNPANNGFFSGLLLDASHDSIYAASYGFYGGTSSGNLVKVRASTGTLLWSVASNRSAATPIRLPGNRLGLSTGIQGFGSLPALQVFTDGATSASLLWSSQTRTWSDSNHNGIIDPGEFTPIGWWNAQPVYSTASDQLAVCGGDNVLRIIDASITSPTSPLTVVASAAAISGSPAVAGGNLYAIGTAGLNAFGPAPALVDVNQDGSFDIEDLYAWEQLRGSRDVNGDGTVTLADHDLLASLLRANEAQEQTEGRR